MTALIAGYGDALYIFFDGGFDDLPNGSVVSEMDDLGTLTLQDPSHDVNGRIVAIKKTGGCDQPYFGCA